MQRRLRSHALDNRRLSGSAAGFLASRAASARWDRKRDGKADVTRPAPRSVPARRHAARSNYGNTRTFAGAFRATGGVGGGVEGGVEGGVDVMGFTTGVAMSAWIARASRARL